MIEETETDTETDKERATTSKRENRECATENGGNTAPREERGREGRERETERERQRETERDDTVKKRFWQENWPKKRATTFSPN